MTKNKIFFMVLGLLVVIGVLYFAMQLNRETKGNTPPSPQGALTLWILEDDGEKLSQYMEDTFKKAFPEYANQEILVESFSERYSYYKTLAGAFLTGNGPDLFMIENSDESVFLNQIQSLDPTIVNPSDFRVRFKPVFGEDLIQTQEDDENSESLLGVPLGYEALGIYFNRRYFIRPSDIETWESLLIEVKNIAEKYSEVIPIALGNGTSITRASDIFVQILTLEGASGFSDLSANNISQAVSLYAAFGEAEGGNDYNSISLPFIGERDVELFTSEKVAAMVGYPRDLLAIDAIGYQKSFLLAHNFPSYAGKEKRTAIKYNILVLNKDSQKKELAQKLLSYIASIEGQQKILETFPYYLPAETSVERDILDKKILPQYNIVYSNFIDSQATLLSFNLLDQLYFTENIHPILDVSSQQDQKIEELKSFIICSTTKHQTLSNLSSPCK